MWFRLLAFRNRYCSTPFVQEKVIPNVEWEGSEGAPCEVEAVWPLPRDVRVRGVKR
jgi:hypothetical protein